MRWRERREAKQRESQKEGQAQPERRVSLRCSLRPAHGALPPSWAPTWPAKCRVAPRPPAPLLDEPRAPPSSRVAPADPGRQPPHPPEVRARPHPHGQAPAARGSSGSGAGTSRLGTRALDALGADDGTSLLSSFSFPSFPFLSSSPLLPPLGFAFVPSHPLHPGHDPKGQKTDGNRRAKVPPPRSAKPPLETRLFAGTDTRTDAQEATDANAQLIVAMPLHHRRRRRHRRQIASQIFLQINFAQ